MDEKQKRIQELKDTYSLTKLAIKVAEFEERTGLRIDSDKQIVAAENRVIRTAWDFAWETFEEYLDPIFMNMMAVNAITGHILGNSLRGDGDLAQQQIAKLTEALLIFVSRTDDNIAQASDAFGTDMSRMFYTEFVRDVLKAAKYFNQTGDGSQLRSLAENKNEVLADMHLDYQNLKRGPKSRGEIIAEKVNEFKKQGHKVKDAIEMTVQFYTKRYHHPTEIEEEIAKSIKNSSDPFALVKADYYNHRDKISALVGKSEK